METQWEEDPVARFWKRLIKERAIDLMRSPEYLKPLRHDYDRAKADQKRFGHIWSEFGTNVFQLIAEAHGENWDAEDEEKHCRKKEAAVTQRDNDDLAPTREESTRERLDQLQGKPEESIRVVEEDQGSPGGSGGRGDAEEEEAPETRQESFYRRAGGTPGT